MSGIHRRIVARWHDDASWWQHGLGLAVLPRQGALPYARALGLVIAPLAGLRTERRLRWAMRERAVLSPAAQALVTMATIRASAPAR